MVNVSLSDYMGQVILSAGVLSIPKILYFSGISPTGILTRLGNATQLCMPSSGMTNLYVLGWRDHPDLFYCQSTVWYNGRW